MNEQGYENPRGAPTRLPGSGTAPTVMPSVETVDAASIEDIASQVSPDEIENLENLVLQGGDIGIRAADVLSELVGAGESMKSFAPSAPNVDVNVETKIAKLSAYEEQLRDAFAVEQVDPATSRVSILIHEDDTGTANDIAKAQNVTLASFDSVTDNGMSQATFEGPNENIYAMLNDYSQGRDISAQLVPIGKVGDAAGAAQDSRSSSGQFSATAVASSAQSARATAAASAASSKQNAKDAKASAAASAKAQRAKAAADKKAANAAARAKARAAKKASKPKKAKGAKKKKSSGASTNTNQQAGWTSAGVAAKAEHPGMLKIGHIASNQSIIDE